jgi:outer membrane protein OmpA-like peptidoglycan-associated protein
MQKALLLVTAALIAGCAQEPQAGRYATPAYPPPRPARETPLVAQRTAPAAVKPLGRGLLAASAVEAYMDDAERELRAALRGRGVIVSRMGDDLVINARDDVLFGGNALGVSGTGQGILDAVAASARRFDSTTLVIDGFTDTTGSPDQNQKVSQQRADLVAKTLVAGGVDSHRVVAKGFGTENLKIPTGPNVNEPRNRRIEIRISPQVKT